MLAGLDIGTTGAKITVYSEDGSYLGKFYKSYDTVREGSFAELDADDIFGSVKELLRQATSQYRIDALGIDSLGEAFAMLDENDKALHKILCYTDSRGEEEVKELVEALGEDYVLNIVGVKPHQMFSLPKIMYIKKHEPEVFAKCKRILQMTDFVTYMLTGVALTDYALASRLMAFDVNKREYSKEILSFCGLDEKLFAKPIMLGSESALLKEEIKKELGLDYDLTVTPTGHDQVACAIGAGVFDEGVAVDGAGTVECITPVYDASANLSVLSSGGYCKTPFMDGKFVTYAFQYACGTLTTWFCETFMAGTPLSECFPKLEAGFKEGPTGILVQPHLAGAATPYMDSQSKGLVSGLTLNTSLSDLYKAFLEGVGYDMMLDLEELSKAGIEVKELIATGGGANSKKWLQIKSDMTGLPIRRLESNEAGSRGCAMVAGVAKGLFKDLNDAKDKMVKTKDILTPNAENHMKYRILFEKYKKVYETSKGYR